MAFRFSSSWSMSVMLGTVVWTRGLLSTHFSADEHRALAREPGVVRIGPLHAAEPAGHHLHRDDPLACLLRLLE